jgi:hypothetical protein
MTVARKMRSVAQTFLKFFKEIFRVRRVDVCGNERAVSGVEQKVKAFAAAAFDAANAKLS